MLSIGHFYFVLFAFFLSVVSTEARIFPRGPPAPAKNVTIIKSPSGAQIRYKEPALQGFCNVPGVRSYSGYISLNATFNMYFWFSTAKGDAANKPVTLWMNGGPGGDSLPFNVGIGPCKLFKNKTTGKIEGTEQNSYDFTQYSNMLFLSQPLGVGFSYETLANSSKASFPVVEENRDDTTRLAAEAAWEIVQAFMDALPQLDANLKSKTFNIWGVSYEGRYGPTFMEYFSEQNQKIANASLKGTALHLDVLGIDSGCIDPLEEYEMMPYFARTTSLVDESVIQKMLRAYNGTDGCKARLESCNKSDVKPEQRRSICSQAAKFCENKILQPFVKASGRHYQDIRKPRKHHNKGRSPVVRYLNEPAVLDALGVSVNYTAKSSHTVHSWFNAAGDKAFLDSKLALEKLLNAGIRVALVQSDNDLICNWMGARNTLSHLTINCYKDRFAFNRLELADGKDFMLNSSRDSYGKTWEFGKLSFAVLQNSAHGVAGDQPKAALEHFRRAIEHLPIADGKKNDDVDDVRWYEKNSDGHCEA